MDYFNKKLGYYVCGKYEFESKIQAYLHSIKTNTPISWVFNDSEFEKHNWTIEPENTLDYYYDQRARNLREKYDYLILSYSGGADSHNILMSFIRQKLHIDEIVINTMDKGSSKFTIIDPLIKNNWNTGAEHYLQTLPRLKEVEKFIPKTKITILDLTDHLFEYLNNTPDESWILNRRERLNPVGITRFNYIYFSNIRKKFDKNKTIGILLGIDKPKCIIHKNKFYMRFNDRTTNIVSIVDHFKDYTNSTLEYFYWDPECIPMLIKQGHIIKKWLESSPQYIKLWNSETTSFKIASLDHERLLRNILYTTWNDSWFQVDKPVSDWYCEFDSWFIDGFKGTKANDTWRRGVEYASSLLTPYLRTGENNSPDGLNFFVKSFCLGDINLRSI